MNQVVTVKVPVPVASVSWIVIGAMMIRHGISGLTHVKVTLPLTPPVPPT